MPESSRVIPVADYRREPWSNGLGTTREIARGSSVCGSADVHAHTSDGQDWPWRLSIADIDHDAAYSTFQGVRREQVLLSGNGVRLAFDDGEQRELEPPHGRACFDGARGVRAELLEGPVQVFNLMWRPDCVSAELLHRPWTGSMGYVIEPGVLWAVHLLAGRAGFGVSSGLPLLQGGDTALLAGSDGGSRHMLEGGGEILAIRIAGRESSNPMNPGFQ